MCHGSLKVKTLAQKAGDLWFESRLWSILIFLIFPENLKKCFRLHRKRRNPGCSLAVEYLEIVSCTQLDACQNMSMKL